MEESVCMTFHSFVGHRIFKERRNCRIFEGKKTIKNILGKILHLIFFFYIPVTF